MTQQTVDIGVQGNDGTGDSIRESFRKVNENFTEIYAVFGAGGTIKFTNLGDAPSSYTANQVLMANTLGTLLTARSLVAGTGILINTSDDTKVTIASTAQGLVSDATGYGLGGDLNANTFTIGNLPDPSEELVARFNQTFENTTTLDQLAINKGYADRHYVQATDGIIINALKPRAQPTVAQTSDPDYDPTLTSNYVSTEAMQRKDVVYRGGDTMSGTLTLSDHPSPLSGAGTPNGTNDLQAATKYYVDNNTYTSNVNLFVSATSGDDAQTKSPVGKEGRFWQYAYKTVGAAALQAETLINLASQEPGPYKQRIAYTVGPNQTFSTIQSVVLSSGNSSVPGYQDAAYLLTANKEFIQSETIAYLNKKYVNYIPINETRYSALLGDLVDGVGYDLVTGSNYNAITFASNLFETKYADLVTEQLTQVLDAIEYVKNTIKDYSYSSANTIIYIGAVIDAIGYDLVFEGSFQSLQIGLEFEKYNTGLSKSEIVATILNLRTELLANTAITISPNAVTSVTNNIALITSTITNNTATVNTFTFPPLNSTPDGLISAKDLLLNNISFMQAEIVAYLQANYPDVIYSKTTCQRDVKYIIWALVYDLMYGGNQRSIHAGLQYWLGNVLQIQGYEKEATVSAISYINTIAQAVINNNSPALVYQTSFRQYTNETIAGGGLASSSISTNIASIASIISSVSAPNPSFVDPTTSAGSSILQSARNSLVTNKVTYEAHAITFINNNPNFSIITNATINSIITTNFNTIENIVQLGVSTRTQPTYPTPTGLALSYIYAKQALLANSTFLAEEAYAWAEAGNTSPTFVPASGVESFKRRMSYIVEAVAYDITYGGNSATIAAGRQYWDNGVNVLSDEETTATSSILTHLLNITLLASQNSVVSPLYSTTSQVRNSLWVDGSAAASDISTLINDIISIVSTNDAVLKNFPIVTGYATILKNARLVIVANKSAIVTNTISHLKSAYKGGFNYNESTCYRDIGYIIDGMSIDLLTAGNYQTVNAGKSYYKNASAKSIAIGTQYTETIDGIEFAKSLGLQVLNQTRQTRYQSLVTQLPYDPSKVAAVGAINTFEDNMNVIVSIITNGLGAAPAASFGTGIYTVTFSNGGNGYVDQGTPKSVHIIPGKILAGATSGANGSIVKYTPGAAPSADTIQVRLTRPGFFQVGEEMDFGETVKDLNITIFVESGIYYEDYPIRLPAQCSIKGDEFRRTIIRPLNRVSQSPWRKIFFYRDAIIDALEVGLINPTLDIAPNTTLTLNGISNKITVTLGSGQAQTSWLGKVIQDNNITPGKAVIDSISGNTMNCSVIYPFAAKTTYTAGQWHLYGTINYGRHYLTDPLDIESTAKNNRNIDVFLCNDATRISNLTMQGHGGFAMVLDPEGQIKTKSPYGQVCTSFSQSINSKRFAGGQFVDGFAGRVFGTITNIADDGITLTVTGSANSGLDIRPPQAPCVFYVQGNRYQVNDIVSFDPATYTVVITLDVGTPFNPVAIYNSTAFATDMGLKIDDITYDLVFGSNYQSIKSGLTYLQPQNSLVGIQQLYRLSGLNKNRDEINVRITTPSSQIKITNSTAIITDIISQGLSGVPTATFPIPVGTNSNVSKATAILIANKAFMMAETIAFIASTYSTKAIYQYNAVKTSRDVGYIIDALTYDLLYGGNSATWDVASFFWSGATSQILSQEPYYGSALNCLQTVITSVVQNIAVTPSAGNLSTQNVSLPVATSGEADTLKTLISIAIDRITDGTINNSVVATTSSGSINVADVNYNPALVAGRTVTGIGIPNSPATTIVSYTAATKVLVLSQGANATNTNVILTISGTTPTRTVPTLPSDASYNTVKADRTTIQNAKPAIEIAVVSYLDSGAGLGINIEMGGNRSMLANDFAMINDLGYAIFTTNGGVSEQVSTFSYYCHTHYWANNGGQIRSVAGSNAHGDYALRSSGYDVTELPDAVTLAYDMMQTAKVYKQGLVSTQMTPTTNTQALSIWILGYDYSPPNNAELEIDHTLSGGQITRYLVSTIEHTTITINGQNVLKLNLSTAGTNSTVTTGLAYTLYDGQLVTIRVNQNIKFNGIDNVRPTRPSTAVQYNENLAEIYRVIAYGLVDSTGETLGANIAILQSDSSFSFYKFNTDGANIANVDPQDVTKTQGSKIGDNKIAVLQISVQQTIDQINKGIYLFGWNGRVHRVLSYTVPTFIATGVFSTYTTPGGIPTLTVTNVAGSIDIGDVLTGTGFTAGQYVTGVQTSGTSSITAVVTLSAVASPTPSGTITFGVAKNGYITIDPNAVHNNAADGTALNAMTYKSYAAGPTGTTYTAVKFDVPFSTTLPAVDSYLTVAGNSTSAYNGTLQVSAVTSSTVISVSSVAGLSVGMVISSLSAGVIIPTSCIIQSINSVANTYVVSPAAWLPASSVVSSTLVAYLSGLTITNGGTVYTNGAPTITLTGGGTINQAIAVAVVENGSITAVNIVSPGYGYTGLPSVSLSYGDAVLTPVLSENPTVLTTVTAGSTTTDVTLAYPTNPIITATATATAISVDLITLGSTTGMGVGMPIVFTGTTFGNIVAGTTYYIKSVAVSTVSVSATYNGATFTLATASGTMTATVSGFSVGTAITVSGFTSKVVSGSGYTVTLTIPSSSITNNAYYKIQGNTNSLYNGFWKCTSATSGSSLSIALYFPYDPGAWSSATTTVITKETTNATSTQLGISKLFSSGTASTLRLGYPAGTGAQITQRISTCRVTGHDLLDIGTGSYTTTNWPTVIYGNPAKSYVQSQEVLEEGVGRVFYVTTDQNGIFRVGRFFTVDQGTGSVTFSASIALSNLDGLGFKRGVVVSEFSTDPSMTNNASDTVPVQSAIRSYIDKRLGLDHGGSPMALSTLIGPGYLALNGTLGMKGTLNMANYGIINVGTPSLSTDVTNKAYVDGAVVAYNSLYKMLDVSITSPALNNILIYDTTNSKWKNASAVGDVTLSFNSGTGVLTSSVAAGAIDNSKVSTTAAIAQSKLAMTIAGTSASNPTGTAAQIQAASGVASFNTNEFTVTNGWVTHKTSSSGTTGVLLSKIQQISTGTLLGNRSGIAASPTEISPALVVADAGGLVNSLFSASGVLSVTYDGSNTGNNTYGVTGVTVTRAASSLIKTGSSGEIDVGFLKVGGYKAVSLTGAGATLTSTFTTPGTYDYMTAIGTTASNTVISTYGTLDTSNGTLKANLLTTDKVGATSGAGAGSASISGWWSVQASSQIDFTLGKLKSTTLTTGTDTDAGTIQGYWSLVGTSRLQATYADLAEYYEGDKEYEPGTVLVFGGDKEVTTTDQINDTRSAGVVTTNPAYIMNSEQTGLKVCIALAGRVPVKVVGRVKKGDMLTTSATPGFAVKALTPTLGAVIGKALEDKDYGEAGVIQVAVGRV
jgi:hypothetical protein